MQMSWDLSKEWSSGSRGLTGTTLVSSTLRHTSSTEGQRGARPDRLLHAPRTVGRSALLEIQDHDLAVDNLDIPSDVDGSERVITGNHDALSPSAGERSEAIRWRGPRPTHPVRRVGKHLEGFDRIGLEGAVEDQEPGELKTAFDLIPMNRVDLPRKSATLSPVTLCEPSLTWF
jgi:hypothetical protein